MPEVQGLGDQSVPCYGTAQRYEAHKGIFCMAEEESILVSPPTQDVAHHVSDYANFTKLLKWGAIVCLVVGLFWMLIVKAYW